MSIPIDELLDFCVPVQQKEGKKNTKIINNINYVITIKLNTEQQKTQTELNNRFYS